MKTCSKCSLAKSEKDFFIKDKKNNRLHAHCKDCYREHRKTYYKQHYAKYGELYRQRARDQRALLRKEFRDNMLEYLSSKECVECHENDWRVLEFDHLDPTQKSFSISQAVKLGYRWPDVKKEIKKCRILCSNCHKKHTAVQASWYKNV